jgi:predicted nucleic acid-binding protein
VAVKGGGDHAALFCDANVLVRLLTYDVPGQARSASRSLDAGARIVLTDVVIAEVCYVLTRGYGFSRAEVSDRLAEVMNLKSIEVADADLAIETLRIWTDARVDFADAYLAALARSVDRAGVLSFDKGLDRIEGVERVDPARY